jgi:hypothetical protein
MSFAKINARALWLWLCVLAPLAGCNEFQTVNTAKWFEGTWMKNDASAPVKEMLTVWDARIRMAEDSTHDGIQRPGLVGRLVLLNDNGFQDAHGRVIVKMEDLTHPEPGKPFEKLGEWSFPVDALKQLKRRDPLGDGYTLFLPWPNYHPAIKEVQVRVCYVPEKGTPRYSTPTRLHLQTDDSMRPVLRERQVIPTGSVQPMIVPNALPTIIPVPTPGWKN